MCGIIGLVGQEEVALDIYRGLLALQHRGQDSAGIACFDKARINLKKGVGLVSEIFDESNLSLLKGKVGIGHVRYGTAGSTPKLDAQPLQVDIPHAIAIAHNGNILNYKQWDEEFRERSETCCDTEVILHLLGKNISSKGEQISVKSVFDGVKKLMGELNGSYCIVALVEDLGLLAFRDPHGVRPLVMGKKGKSVCIASESVALDALGFDIDRDIKPGEAILVEPDGKIHAKVLEVRKEAHCMFEWVYFARPDSTIEGVNVYEARVRLGVELAKIIGKDCECDVVIPVPDTSRPACMGLAAEVGKTPAEGLIKNRYIGRTFIMPTQEGRDKALNVKLNTVKPIIKDKKVLLIDDSVVRGSTARRLIRLVKKDAKSVHLALTCPPIKYPCFYGIDFPIQSELIAYNEKTEEGVRKALGADKLTYQTIEGLRRAIANGEMCTACLDGKYPTAVPEDMLRKLVESRSSERIKARKEYQ